MLAKLLVLGVLIGAMWLLAKYHKSRQRAQIRKEEAQTMAGQITELEQDPETGHYRVPKSSRKESGS